MSPLARTRLGSADSIGASVALLLVSYAVAMAGPVAPASGQRSEAGKTEPVEYRLSFDQRAHHEARVEVLFRDLGDAPLEVVMSRSSPGRYAVHDFAKNLYDVEAERPDGVALEVERASPHSWRIAGHGGAVTFRYTLYGDHCDGTYVAIDRSHAHLNMPASLVWARGLEARPARVVLDVPTGWRVATQLPRVKPRSESRAGPRVGPRAGTATPGGEAGAWYSARDLQHLMDSPIEVSDHDIVEWALESPSPPGLSASSPAQTVRIALHHLGDRGELEVYGRLAQAVAAEQVAVFGEAPRFDQGEYTFLADYLPWCSGDGMEHRNSTVLTSSGALAESTVDLLGTLSHELFHAWSIERMRPRSLEPFDFERANQSGELWFGEGFTSYYGPLMLERAGILSLDRYAEALSITVDTLINARGPRRRSAVEMSLQAPFVDDAASIDVTNEANTYLSYYSYGKALALALDLSLRARFPLTLDQYFAELWRRFGRNETPYTSDDLRTTLGAVTRDSDWADDFFRRFVVGREIPDYAALLEPAALVVRAAHPGRAWLGGSGLSYDGDEVSLAAPSLEGDPLHAAGLDRGDRILELDGALPHSHDELVTWLEHRKPGDRVRALVSQRGESRDIEIVLQPDPTLQVAPVEHLGRAPTARQLAFRSAWLGAKSDHQLGPERHCPLCRRSFPASTEFCPSDGAELLWFPTRDPSSENARHAAR